MTDTDKPVVPEEGVTPNPEDDKEVVTLPRAKYDEIVEALANETQSKTNLVNEIKDLREKRQITETEAEELREKLKAKEDAPGEVVEITPETIASATSKAITEALAEKDSQDADSNREAALVKFKETHKEFHPDNDEGGLKFSAFEKKLKRFNLEGTVSERGFTSIFEDVRALVVGVTPAETPSLDPNPPAPSGDGSGTPPKEVGDDTLSSKELKIINDSFDGDKERFLKIRAKRPDYVASLLQYSL